MKNINANHLLTQLFKLKFYLFSANLSITLNLSVGFLVYWSQVVFQFQKRAMNLNFIKWATKTLETKIWSKIFSSLISGKTKNVYQSTKVWTSPAATCVVPIDGVHRYLSLEFPVKKKLSHQISLIFHNDKKSVINFLPCDEKHLQFFVREL